MQLPFVAALPLVLQLFVLRAHAQGTSSADRSPLPPLPANFLTIKMFRTNETRRWPPDPAAMRRHLERKFGDGAETLITDDNSRNATTTFVSNGRKRRRRRAHDEVTAAAARNNAKRRVSPETAGATTAGDASSSSSPPLSAQQEQLHNSGNTEYFGVVTVGSPGQRFRVLFDTGSTAFWVPCAAPFQPPQPQSASQSSSSAAATAEPARRFLCANSSTCSRSGLSFAINYYNSLVEGHVCADQICGQSFDGIMGLSRGQINAASRLVPPIQQVFANGALCKQRLFAMYLTRRKLDADDDAESVGGGVGKQSGGQLTICGINAENFVGEMVWVPVLRASSYWQIHVAGVSLGEQPLVANTTAIIDSGTSLLAGPLAIVGRINKIIGATAARAALQSSAAPNASDPQQYEVECERVALLPELRLIIGGRVIALSANEYILKSPTDDGGMQCLSGFIGVDLPSGAWILGDLFIARYYTVFDVDGERVGLASAASPSDTQRSSTTISSLTAPPQQQPPP